MTISIINHTHRAARITNFTKARYLESDYMRLERERIWADGWLLAGLEADVSASGDFFTFEIGNEQIIVVRTRAGTMQGFFNVCQHRGNRLVTTERGHADNFRCAYHAWTYDIDGALKAVPQQERFADGVPFKERALRPVHTSVWDGFVFVSLQDDPPALESFLGPVIDHLAPYRFRGMTLVEDQTVELNCNWKAVIDNFSELYHVDFLHPQHRRMVDCCNDTVHLFENGHTGLWVKGATVNPRFPIPNEPTDIQSAQLKSLNLNPQDFIGKVLDVRRAVQVRKREIGRDLGYDYDHFNDDQLSDVWQYNLFPNIILSFSAEHCWVMRARPHPTDPQRCWFDKISLALLPDSQLGHTARNLSRSSRPLLNESAEANKTLDKRNQRPVRDVFPHQAILSGEKSMTITIDQDIELLGNVQAGMNSRGFGSVWLNDDEMRVQHFHNRVDELMAR